MKQEIAYYWLTDSWSTSTIVSKGCGRNNMENVMRNNVHCDAIKLTWIVVQPCTRDYRQRKQTINANFSECKFAINYVGD